jgi:hypothetical protein
MKTENMNKEISANSVTSNEASKLPKLTNEGKGIASESPWDIKFTVLMAVSCYDLAET